MGLEEVRIVQTLQNKEVKASSMFVPELVPNLSLFTFLRWFIYNLSPAPDHMPALLPS